MMRISSAVLFLLLLTGCGVGEGTGSTPPWAQPETPVAGAVDTAELPPDVEAIPPYKVRLETTQGEVIIDVHPEWAPWGAKRFKELVEAGYYDDIRIFRVMPGFVAQFGMHGDPDVNRQWHENFIPDDRVKVSNKRGYVTFATSGPNSRTAQVFINLTDNPQLDTMQGSFAPFGEVVEGMDVVDAFNSQYEGAPGDKQPQIAEGGNLYLDEAFPGLDSIVKATIVGDSTGDAAATQDAAEDAAPTEPPAEDESTTDQSESAQASDEATPPADESAPAEKDNAPTDESATDPAPDETPEADPASDTDESSTPQ